MMKQSLEQDKKWKLWLEFQLWSSPIMMDALKPTSSTFFLIQSLLKIFSDEFASSSAFIYCWFSCFHSLCYLGKTISWDPRQLNHIYAIINKKFAGKKYARMRLVPLSSFAIIKIPVNPATLDAWEELLIYQFKPSLNSLGISNKNSNPKILSASGINNPDSKIPKSEIRLSRKSLRSINLSWTIFSSASWSSTSLVTLVDPILGKGKSSLMISILHGQMLNIQQNVWSQVFAQAQFSCIINNSLQHNLPFCSLINLIQKKLIDSFVISVSKSDPLYKKENILQILRRKNAKVQEILGNYSLPQIMEIFDQSAQFKDCFWINEVKLILKNFGWMKFGFRISNSLPFSSPAHSLFPPSYIRQFLDSIIACLHVSQERKQCLRKRTVIHQKKNPSLADFFFNHRSWAKSWKESILICECQSLKNELDVQLWNGHISSWHYEPKNPKYSALLKLNMNDILHPVPKVWSRAFMTALSKWLRELGKISCPSYFSFVDFLQIDMSKQPMEDLILSILKQGHIFPSRHLVQTLKDLEENVNKISPLQEQSMSLLSLKESIPNSLVLGPYDKNIGRLDIYCPAILHQHMMDNFWNNQKNYTRCYLSQGAIIDSFKSKYKSRNWESIAKWHNSNSLPIPMITRKDKDASRIRAMVSYFHHPLKRVLLMASRGLMTILKAIKFNHGNLFSPFEGPNTAKKAYDDLIQVYGNQSQIEIYGADIKEMYTFLPQEKILQAIRDLLSYMKRKSRRDSVVISRSSPKKCRLGKSYLDIPDLVSVSFKELYRIISFDIKNCHVKIDWLILSQTLGIPIGSPNAPPCSMVICIMDERKFHNSLTLYHPYYRFFRYFDDLRMMVVTSKQEPINGPSKKRSSRIVQKIQEECYDKNLILVPEKFEDGKMKFLEGSLSFNSGFSSKFEVKNYEYWLKQEASRFFLGKSFASFSADPHHKVRKATCIGKLHSLSFYSYSLQDLLEGFIQVLLHFNDLGYPLKMVAKACFKMKVKSGDKKWEFLGKWVRFINKRLK